MDTESRVAIRMLDGIAECDAARWDACAAPEAADGGRARDPFATHRFLSAFEDSGSAKPRAGWDAKHLLAEDEADGTLLGVMPLYAKSNSYGEYIFDHGWAQAFERAGGYYYPKLLSAIPFTPVTGRRLLVHPDADAEIASGALTAGMIQVATENRLSSVHVNFCTETEKERLVEAGFLGRLGQQFHWQNRDYADFDGFLADLASRKRKAIRKERRQANEAVTVHAFTGDDIRPEHWDAFWVFYQDTGARKWGTPYLTRQFFEIAQDSLRDDILLVLAEHDGRWVAGAMNVIGREALYGRYWGCTEHHPCLHFELCYYRAIDFAIEHGLKTVEAGAQGEHKLARGYVPTGMHSAHFIPDPGFREAVRRFVDQEAEMVGEEMEMLGEFTPFRKGD